ncbi:vanin-like protein 1 [Ostrinia furnacalis]|uniref:vanin-like protein 1 n=1 Tax=Ostrinia furnacalis TaxID=93504 RepID=UPI00103BC309|nr:vanin-like protein 1 [Ostrinia furnacalis]
MAPVSHLVVIACLLGISTQRSTPTDDSYVAAVLEYQPAFTTAANLARYEQFIQDAALQDADIIVFPELTLDRQDPVEVPFGGRLKEYPVPALYPDLYHEILVNISAAARENAIYVVINVEEIVNCTGNAIGEVCPEEKIYLFNTNVVFDRNGTVIDRYRKINLFGERTRTPALGPDLGVFETDFGVTFGHYICFDLQFQVPALQLVEKLNITDVIFPTMWFSELPYLTAVQIQEAYAYAMDVNFLGSGANNVRVGSAGSGIYSGKAGALVSTMPGLLTTRMLVSRVPKVPGQVTFQVPGPIYDPAEDHDSLVLISDPSFPSHVTRRLVPGFQEFTLVDREVSCVFRINMTENTPASGVETYRYRAAAFSGVRSYSGVATGGTRICSVVACTGDTMDTCARRFPAYNANTTAIFEELSIVASVPTPVVVQNVTSRDSAYFPVSLDVSIMPLESEYYSYTEDNRGENTVYSMNLINRDAELYSFAVWGRYFLTDGLDADPPLVEVESETEASEPDTSEPVTSEPDTTEPDAGGSDSANVREFSILILLTGLACLIVN